MTLEKRHSHQQKTLRTGFEKKKNITKQFTSVCKIVVTEPGVSFAIAALFTKGFLDTLTAPNPLPFLFPMNLPHESYAILNPGVTRVQGEKNPQSFPIVSYGSLKKA